MKELDGARIKMLLKHPFFAYLIMGLEEKFDTKLPAVAGTDGKTLYIKPAEFKALPVDQRIGVLAHEAYHLAFGHPGRTGTRKAMVITPTGPMALWPVACDFPVNEAVDADGLALPADALRDPKYKGWTSEAVYEDLLSKGKKVPGTGGMCCGEGWGETDEQGNPRYREGEWADKIASAAEAARMQGKLPASVESLVDSLLHPKLDWRTILREFIQASVKTDYRRNPANKHYLHRGIVLPSLQGEEVTVGVAIDTSGSISDNDLRDFLSEITAITQQFDGYRLHIWQCDAAVQDYSEVTGFEGTVPRKMKGRGGTSFVPVFQDIEERRPNLPILVYFTDGFGDFPQKAPDYNVLWVITGGGKTKVPFGQQVALT